MTVNFRLLAGFTSFISKRCLSHFSSMGPSGTLELSSMSLSACLSRLYHAGVDGDRNHREARPDDQRQGQGKLPPQGVRRGRAHPQAPATAPDAVIQVE